MLTVKRNKLFKVGGSNVFDVRSYELNYCLKNKCDLKLVYTPENKEQVIPFNQITKSNFVLIGKNKTKKYPAEFDQLDLGIKKGDTYKLYSTFLWNNQYISCMSRSYKKNPIYKDSSWLKKKYWSIVRSRHKTELNSGVHPEDLTNPKEIVNDYDYSDWHYHCWEEDCHCMKQYGFKKCMNK